MKLDVKKNTIMGALAGIGNKLIVTLLPFIMRTIMIHYMGTQYLGLSSLFSSILNMLSLAELGFGGALVYSMYKPIAENDTNKICALMGLYRKVYRIIGTCILVLGIAIMPFLENFISGDVPSDINIYSLYLIYLANTVASYFLFAYKNSLLVAFQRNDISSNVGSILTVLEYSIQIALVMIFRNYYCYAIVFPIFTVLGNVIRAIIVQKKYPEYVCRGKVNKAEQKEIYSKTLALASHKIGNTVSSSLDSIVVSSFLGLSSVAIFGNYNYIVSTLTSMIWIVYYSMTAGIGNRMNLKSKQENYSDFLALSSFNNMILMWSTGCLIVLYQPFMKLWAGVENMLHDNMAFVFALYYYVYQSRKIVLLFKDAAGLWKEDQWKPIVGAVVNLVLNIVMIKLLGMNGVILSSIIAFVLIEIPWESRVLNNVYFNTSTKEYLFSQVKAFFIAVPIWGILVFVCKLVPFSGVAELICKGIIAAVLPIPYMLIIYRNDKELLRIIKKIIP